ncbi:TIGR01777 family protein [bacterium]|nr:TIGR01777 family protein [bacterium]
MRILVSGASGFVGSAIMRELSGEGHTVLPLLRISSAHLPSWDPARGEIAAQQLEGFDAVIHLAGASLAEGRWTRRRRHLFRESRVPATRLLCETLSQLESPPKVFIVASAVGIYGSRGDEELDEESSPGKGFLAELGQDWEAASLPASEAGIRVVQLRMGMVLGQSGGALPKLTPLFLAGLGGRLGSGRQWMSWVSLDDLLTMFKFILDQEELSGAINAVADDPLRNVDFTKELARALRRRAWLPVPAFALKLLMGKMADEMLLASQRVRPARLLEAGFQFEHPNLRVALEHVLGTRKGRRA